jgi:hypothetical protein
MLMFYGQVLNYGDLRIITSFVSGFVKAKKQNMTPVATESIEPTTILQTAAESLHKLSASILATQYAREVIGNAKHLKAKRVTF